MFQIRATTVASRCHYGMLATFYFRYFFWFAMCSASVLA
jgi:hypothetical protein